MADFSDPSHRACGRRLAVASASLTLFAATICGADTSRDVVLWSANDQWVKIVPQDDPAAPPNEHPAQLPTEEVSHALRVLQVRIVDKDTGTETQRSVFTSDEIQNLAPRVASGLAQAGPRQDVTFSTTASHPLSNGGFVRAVGINAGRVFYDDGKLNVIFGELQSSYRKKNLYGQRTEDFNPRRQGARDKEAEQKLRLAASPGVEFRSIDGAVRNDWVTIDSEVATSAAQSGSAPAATRTQASASAGGGKGDSAGSSRIRGGQVQRRCGATSAYAQGSARQGSDQRRGIPCQDAGDSVRALGSFEGFSEPMCRRRTLSAAPGEGARMLPRETAASSGRRWRSIPRKTRRTPSICASR